MRKVHRVQFDKLHERARECINTVIAKARGPLYLRDIQAEVMSACHLRVSRPWLGKYLRKKLGVTYRRIKPIKPIQNAPSAKLQRQLAAAKFIEALHSGKRIINIDETVLRYTDARLRGWID